MRKVRERVHRWVQLLPIACAGLLSPLAPAPAAGQEPVDAAVQVVLAALPHVKNMLPTGPAVLDPGDFCTARLFGWDCPAGLQSAADELGLRLHSREFAYVCLGEPSTCQLVGTHSLVAPSQLEIQGSTARLLVDTWWRTGDRERPVGHQRNRLVLERRGDRWLVTRSEPLLPR